MTKNKKDKNKDPKNGSKDGSPSETDTAEKDAADILEGKEEGSSSLPSVANEESKKKELPFPIVGIGASAGGLAALESFFSNIPTDTETGIAFVIVQHLDPDHKSMLTELLRRYTRMKVYEVENEMTVEPNCAYIIPPNKDMVIRKGKLCLMETVTPRGLRLPIDLFFRSLAQERGEKAVCIVLSGTGTDGAQGLKAIKEVGGMAMVQTPDSAGYDGMPKSAIATGMADYILSPNEMPAQLLSYLRHAFGHSPTPVTTSPLEAPGWMHKIFSMLRSHTGHDFSFYKQSTINRRVERRMAVNQIAQVDRYIEYIKHNPTEMDALFQELLIGVTGFFRDPEAFESLEATVITGLIVAKPIGATVRVWVPGCSTGEEAYSIAILLQEQAEKLRRDIKIQIFATDIDSQAIGKARAGLYPANITADVSAERLLRFFTQDDDNFYRVKKSIRDIIVFAEQDLIKDTPFSRIDLISCRNLLIYMESELQKKTLPLFHYSLNPGGFLFLGNSETVGDFINLFVTVDKKWKIYQRQDWISLPTAVMDVPAMPLSADSESLPQRGRRYQKDKKTSAREQTEKLLMQDYAPSAVTIDDQGEILYVHGRTGKYLEFAQGEISTNIMRTAREGLKMELATALRKSMSQKQSVRYDGLQIKWNDNIQKLNLIVKPLPSHLSETGLFIVIFEAAASEPEAMNQPLLENEAPSDNLLNDKAQHITILEHELRVKEEYLHTTVEELETANEELKSTIEELQSTNEELQSTNEELETSKEELQLVNEELVTVNTELQKKIDELSISNNDMNNLLAGTGIGTIFVDNQLLIQRFTPAVTKIINLIQTDLGRPLRHIVSNLVNYATNFVEDVKSVLSTLIPKETEVQTIDGLWYLLRIHPYRTPENVIEGAVITFIDSTKRKRVEDALRQVKERMRLIISISGLRCFVWEITINKVKNLTSPEGDECDMGTIEDFYATIHPEDRERTRATLEESAAKGKNYEIQFRAVENGNVLCFLGRGIVLRDKTGDIKEVIGINMDITKRNA